MEPKDRRYNVTLAPQLDKDLEELTVELGVSKAEVMRRALTLFKHATHADAVKLVNDGKETQVLIK